MNYPAFLESLEEYVMAADRQESARQAVMREGGEVVKLLRSISKISLRKFAVILDVSPSYLSKVERGKESISPTLARKILGIQGERGRS